MRKLGLTLLMAAVSAAPVSAGAGGWSWTWANACGGNNFITCMSGSISYSGSGNTLEVFVRNDAPFDGDLFRAVGLFNMPAGLTPVIDALDLDWATDSSAPYPGISGPLDAATYAITSNQGNEGFGEDGIFHAFTFTFGGLSYADMMALETRVGVGVHAISGLNGCSTKVGVRNPNGDATGEGVNNYDPESAEREGCVSVPEPESYALLATGIAGLLFVAARRRNGIELVDENGNDVAA